MDTKKKDNWISIYRHRMQLQDSDQKQSNLNTRNNQYV